MAKKKVFISYDYSIDRKYKNMLLAWDKNSEFDFSFEDHSADISIDSTSATTIKRAISAKINRATYFLCLVGKKTANSRWVKWEIDKAVELKKKVVAVKIERSNTTPVGLLGVGASWAYSFTLDAIKRALNG